MPDRLTYSSKNGTLGVLITKRSLRDEGVYFQQLSAAAAAFGQKIVFFTPSQVDWEKRIVSGYRLLAAGGKRFWIKHFTPLPAVIYNRIRSRRTERSASVQDLLNQAKSFAIPVFNSSFLFKDDVYEVLRHTPAERFLPQTYTNPDPAVLISMAEQYPSVFLKPAGGSRGAGIVRIKKIPDAGWEFSGGSKGNFYAIRHWDWNEWIHSTGKLTDPSYLAQQGIALRTWQGRPADFRIHLQRGALGDWELIGTCARVGGERAVTTHIQSGGEPKPAGELFQAWYGSLGEIRLQNVCDAALEVAVQLEKNSDCVLGEVGIDIGIDQNDQIWLFEVNSKPDRWMFDCPHLQAAGANSARKIFEFAKFLRMDKNGRNGGNR